MKNRSIAHIKKLDDDWIIQTVEDHLKGTSELASKFSKTFQSSEWGEICGILHDIGKCSDLFQKRIRILSGYDENCSNSVPKVDHSTAGAQFAVKEFGEQVGKFLAYIIAGHHSGIPNGKDNTQSCLTDRLNKKVSEYINKLPEMLVNIASPNPKMLPCSSYSTGFTIALCIRMLFSCLVDADSLDTESFTNPIASKNRKNSYSLNKLLDKLDVKIKSFNSSGDSSSKINTIRKGILDDCLNASLLEPGFFSLTVPTGGGKTISSLAFGIKHALKYNKKRVIYVIPYTSIIEQNTDVFRKILGNMSVLEHHSNFDSSKIDDDNAKNYLKLSSQNWDAPVVVTTNVQFFESLFSNKPSACRKLHNIVNSVIILDEAQMLPVDLLKPCLESLKELVRGYGCSIVVCSATQPALRSSELKGGLDNIREIVKNPVKLHHSLKRISTKFIGKVSDNELVTKIKNYNQSLTIVSTKKHAKRIFDLLPENNKIHLSSLMCPEHRTVKINTIKEKLKNNEECYVSSTQLIEAGVDIDFPAVFRSIAGIDSISQSAGRCNREDKLDTGYVYIFEPDDSTLTPPGFLKHSADIGRQILRLYQNDPLSVNAVNEYFRRLYWQKSEKLDKHDILKKLEQSVAKFNFPFRDIDSLFRIIDQNTKSIIIPYKEKGCKLCEQIRNSYFKPNIEILQKIQRYTVQVHPHVFGILNSTGVLESFLEERFWIVSNPDLYDDDLGLVYDNPFFYKSDTLII